MLTVHYENGRTEKVQVIDGGGAFAGTRDYEVHGTDEEGGFWCVLQRDIKKVVDAEGRELKDWGNKFFPGHPDYDPDNDGFSKAEEEEAEADDRLGYDDFAEAATTVDLDGESNGFTEALQHIGIDRDGAIQAAQQRAMRAAVIMTDGPTGLTDLQEGTLKLTDRHRKLIVDLMPMWLDGLAIGARSALTKVDDALREG